MKHLKQIYTYNMGFQRNVNLLPGRIEAYCGVRRQRGGRWQRLELIER
jgi:hypothetical protein